MIIPMAVHRKFSNRHLRDISCRRWLVYACKGGLSIVRQNVAPDMLLGARSRSACAARCDFTSVCLLLNTACSDVFFVLSYHSGSGEGSVRASGTQLNIRRYDLMSIALCLHIAESIALTTIVTFAESSEYGDRDGRMSLNRYDHGRDEPICVYLQAYVSNSYACLQLLLPELRPLKSYIQHYL